MNQQKDLNNLVALFLAEAIRSRRTSLSRAAEISQRVVSRIQGLTSENDVLKVLTNLEKDFREVTSLKQALHFGYRPSEIKVYESEIKDFASKLFAQDMKKSAEFLREATEPGATIQTLCLKYPKFCDFIYEHSEKAPMISGMHHAPC